MNKLVDYELLNKEELYFYYWLEELYVEGYVDYIYPLQSSFHVCKGYSPEWIKKGVRKNSRKEFNLIKDRFYTNDFSFEFNWKALAIFYYNPDIPIDKRLPFIDLNNRLFHVDVKGNFTRGFTSGVTFPDRQGSVWNNYKQYVHKIIPFGKKTNLFNITFVPKKVQQLELHKRNSEYGKKGDIKKAFKGKSLKQYVDERYDIINRWK